VPFDGESKSEDEEQDVEKGVLLFLFAGSIKERKNAEYSCEASLDLI
jgi:hypothetical protein